MKKLWFFKEMIHKKLNTRGFTLIELLVAISLLAVLITPAYGLVMNGQRVFMTEVDYQKVVSDVHMFFEYVNSTVRRAGFTGVELELDSTGNPTGTEYEIVSIAQIGGEDALKVKNISYTREGTSLVKLVTLPSGTLQREVMVDHISGFNVTEDVDAGIIHISVKISHDGIDEVVSTKIYRRYQDE